MSDNGKIILFLCNDVSNKAEQRTVSKVQNIFFTHASVSTVCNSSQCYTVFLYNSSKNTLSQKLYLHGNSLGLASSDCDDYVNLRNGAPELEIVIDENIFFLSGILHRVRPLCGPENILFP